MKLILGTAEFGRAYGYGVTKPPTLKEIHSILTLARDVGIDTLDTAESYGVNKLIRGYGFKIISKVRFPYDEIRMLQELEIDEFEGLLYHYKESETPINPRDFHRTRVINAGSSIYNLCQLTGKEEIVQLACNINKPLTKWNSSATLIVRSVFDGGKLLEDRSIKECLDYVAQFDKIYGVVVGVNSVKELEDILKVWY